MLLPSSSMQSKINTHIIISNLRRSYNKASRLKPHKHKLQTIMLCRGLSWIWNDSLSPRAIGSNPPISLPLGITNYHKSSPLSHTVNNSYTYRWLEHWHKQHSSSETFTLKQNCTSPWPQLCWRASPREGRQGVALTAGSSLKSSRKQQQKQDARDKQRVLVSVSSQHDIFTVILIC